MLQLSMGRTLLILGKTGKIRRGKGGSPWHLMSILSHLCNGLKKWVDHTTALLFSEVQCSATRAFPCCWSLSLWWRKALAQDITVLKIAVQRWEGHLYPCQLNVQYLYATKSVDLPQKTKTTCVSGQASGVRSVSAITWRKNEDLHYIVKCNGGRLLCICYMKYQILMQFASLFPIT